MEPTFNPFGGQDDPTDSSWIQADLPAESVQSEPQTTATPPKAAAMALPPLLAPPPPQEEQEEDFVQVLEARLARLKKKRPVFPSDSNQPIHHAEIGETEIYKTKMEAETERLLEEGEVFVANEDETSDPVSHPRYASLAATRIDPAKEDSESEEEVAESTYGEMDS